MRTTALLALAALYLSPLCATPATAGQVLGADKCAALSGLVITPGEIGLPTSGGRITAATKVAADPKSGPEHCLVAGEIAPADKGASNIDFHLALPADWNGKAVMFGGGGLDGVIPDVAGNPQAAQGVRTPLARGYAVFGSDGGHQSPGAEFATNDEAWNNYLGDALKKTRDAVFVVIRGAYGASPTRAYFLGGSKGGAEALAVAARWPADWDGVVSLYPARNPILVTFGLLTLNQAIAAPGAFPPLEHRALVYQAALERCDGLDGVKDGVISDVSACRKAFDPMTATLGGAPLACPAGAAADAPCIPRAEFAALKAIDTPFALPFPIGGETAFPGFNAFTSDTGAPGSAPARMGANMLTFGLLPPASPYHQGMAISFGLVDPFMRQAVLRDPAADAIKLDLNHPPAAAAARLQGFARSGDADLDLSGFARKGGKLILLQGTEDFLITPRGTEAYYEKVSARLGHTATDRMLRFYEVPGFGHSTSAVFGMIWDQLGVLERWVEQGADPAEHETATDTTGVPGRTRPLCLYPRWPMYRGSGDPNNAASFVCTAPRP
jgi:Tannase and feruloyl esterase